jgi:acetyl esterase/lipase
LALPVLYSKELPDMKTWLTGTASGCLLVCTLSLAAAGGAGQDPLVLDVFTGKVPGETKPIPDEKFEQQKPTRLLHNVSKPTLTVFRPAKDKDTGAAVIVAPGGGYNILAWDHEGLDVAAWLNSIGVTGIVLKYRVPRRADHPKAPLQDAQRAVSLVRSKATEWGLDPKRIGMLGFSAGGHLAAVTATNFDQRAYEPIDAIDKVGCRPDFAVLVYPGLVVSKGKDELAPEVRVSKDAPPMFFAHCSDDKVVPENSIMLYLALKKVGVPAEMHIYAAGGHGFGLDRAKYAPANAWPKRCEEWLRTQGLLKVAGAP